MADLTPADPVELRQAVVHALRFWRNGRRTQDHAELMAHAAAEHVIEMLRLAGFVIMGRPQLEAHWGEPAPHVRNLTP